MEDNELMAQEKEEKKAIEKKRWVLPLSKPFIFEGNTYKELDLSGLEDLSADDLINAEKIYQRMGGTSVSPETTVLYGVIITAMVAQLPNEFFIKFPAKDANRIKNMVYRFFYR
ncbi:MAG: phage tail assembly protein [Velocimicrobium sp.]